MLEHTLGKNLISDPIVIKHFLIKNVLTDHLRTHTGENRIVAPIVIKDFLIKMF